MNEHFSLLCHTGRANINVVYERRLRAKRYKSVGVNNTK